MNPSFDRRRFLKLGTGTAGALLLGGSAKAMAQACGLTPPQTEGPFYPGEHEFSHDTDLTRVPGSRERAQGQVVSIAGRVLDPACRPIAGANVEIWQACASGRYNNPRDPNPAPLDPNFRYWAETYTNEQGEYSFTTIIPGAYPADSDWWRPPHIHFKVTRLGYDELTTQMYFKGEALNQGDLILRRLPRAEREKVVVELVGGGEAPVGTFDITLRPVRTP